MINNYVSAQYTTIVEYDLVFDDGYHNGFAFPCDENGVLLDGVPECAMENYKWCLERPDKFVRFNKVVKNERRVRENAYGTCACGNKVELYDEYYGACQCEKCGQWYNLSGQELLPPEDWQENFDDEYDW